MLRDESVPGIEAGNPSPESMTDRNQAIRLSPALSSDTTRANPRQGPAPRASASREPTRGTGIVAKAVATGSCPACGAGIRYDAAPPLSTATCSVCGAAFLVPGQLDGFLLLERIGEGEMGEIFRARDEALNRDVAIKIVRGVHADDEENHARLRREAQAAASVSHPRVAQVFALGFSNGHPYLVMELVCGEDLDVVRQREGRVDERTALRAAGEVVEGLDALHRLGLTHGDIKPANIVLDADGAAKLVDFGLSGMSRKDGRGAIHGTPHYLAPELLRGAADTPLTDLYSLGATLYHVLAGQPPFDGATPTEVLRARLTGPPEPIGRRAPHLSLAAQRLVMRLLDTDPARRPPNCAAVLAAIREARAALDGPARHPGRTARGTGSPRRRRIAFAVLVLIALVELAMVLRMAIRRAPQPSVRSVARTLPGSTRLPGAAEPDWNRQAAPTPPAYVRRLDPRWFSANLGDRVRGSTVWRDHALIILSDGRNLDEAGDDCRYVHAGVAGDFALTAEVAAIATTHADAKTGLLVRSGRDPTSPGLFFGLLGDGNLLLQVRGTDGRLTVVRRAADPVFLPCRIRLARHGKQFSAATSGDDRSWQPFADCTLDLNEQVRAGLAVASGAPGTMATAELRDPTLLVPEATGPMP